VRPYSPAEKIAHAATHGFGLLLSIVALPLLVVLAAFRGNAWHVVSVSIYGGTLVLLYAASTLYHSSWSPRMKEFFRILDNVAIFLLIAGTYTPFTLVSLRGGWGWALFGVVWGVALFGVLLESVARPQVRTFSLVLYLGLGWLAVVAAGPLIHSVDRGGLVLLLAGGLAYTGGVVFYLMRRLPFHHAAWHVSVLVGSAFHFFAILYYVVPPATV
jgi:hemolysin III